jgi:hypothetical protein
MKENYASQPNEIELFPVGSGQTDVIIRTNINQIEEDVDGSVQKMWQCDEVQFRYDGVLAMEDVCSKVEKWLLFADRDSIDALTAAKEKLINTVSKICNATITAGFNATLSDGESHHFSLEMTDQLMISMLAAKATSDQTAVPWHADGEDCKFFSPDDITLVNGMMEDLVIYNEAYFNSLRRWIQSVSSLDELSVIYYGAPIPSEYQSEVLKALLTDVRDD